MISNNNDRCADTSTQKTDASSLKKLLVISRIYNHRLRSNFTLMMNSLFRFLVITAPRDCLVAWNGTKRDRGIPSLSTTALSVSICSLSSSTMLFTPLYLSSLTERKTLYQNYHRHQSSQKLKLLFHNTRDARIQPTMSTRY